MTDPEDTVSVSADEHLPAPLPDGLPIEANEADVLEQLQDVPDLGEDDYRG